MFINSYRYFSYRIKKIIIIISRIIIVIIIIKIIDSYFTCITHSCTPVVFADLNVSKISVQIFDCAEI